MTSRASRPAAAPTADAPGQVAAWAASGAMALTGRADAPPLGPPDGLVPRLVAAGARVRELAASSGGHLDLDPLALLGERAAIAGLRRRGEISCGGATRLLRAGSAWVAVTLARPDDVELVPAWLELDDPPDDVWSTVAAAAATRPVEALVERAVLLGLPIGLLPATPPAAPDGAGAPVGRTRVPGPPVSAGPLSGVVVLDLSSLWAGPLCGSLLAHAGARVIKVESLARPDGARGGPVAFFDLLNAHKRSVAVDLRTNEGVQRLHALLSRADVVIEGSRPRALEQLGIDAHQLLGSATTRVWASITGHGRTGVGGDRVAFGDDAAVSGGLVSWAGRQPCFCADAVADPTTGLVAAASILEALDTGGRWLLDISMARVAAHLAGPTLVCAERSLAVAPPVARAAPGRGPRLGEHTAEVLAELGA